MSPWVASLAVVGAVVDLRSRRIPNVLTIPAMVVGVGLSVAGRGWEGFGDAVGGIAVGLALLAVPFALRLAGAGDVKFLMAFGGFLGPRSTVEAFLWSTAAGGLLALAVLGVTQKGRRRALTSWIQFRNFVYTRDASVLKPAIHNDTIAVPYGLALAIGAVTAGLRKGILLG